MGDSMKKVNVVFDEDYSDVDIILVPESILPGIDSYLQAFFDWAVTVPNRKKYEIVDRSGKTVVSLGTIEFVNWLNEHVLCLPECATILEQHTECLPEVPVIDF